MLSAHNLLVAAIFVPYMVMMGGLFAYIAHTASGKDQDEPPDTGDGPEEALLAA